MAYGPGVGSRSYNAEGSQPQQMAYGPSVGSRSYNAQGSQPQEMAYGPGVGSRANQQQGPAGQYYPQGPGPEGMMEIDTRAKQAPYGPTFGTRNTVREQPSPNANAYQPQGNPRSHQPQGPAGPATGGRRPPGNM